MPATPPHKQNAEMLFKGVVCALIGAVILTLLPQVLAAVEQYEAMILGGIMMGTMIFMPKGLLPSLRLLWSKRRGVP